MSKRSKPTMAPRKPLPVARPAPRLAPSQVAALEAEAGEAKPTAPSTAPATAPTTAASTAEGTAPSTAGGPEAKPTRAQVRDTPRRRADLAASDRPPPERMTVHLEAELAQALRAEAGRRRWSLSYAVGEAVRVYLESLEGRGPGSEGAP